MKILFEETMRNKTLVYDLNDTIAVAMDSVDFPDENMLQRNNDQQILIVLFSTMFLLSQSIFICLCTSVIAPSNNDRIMRNHVIVFVLLMLKCI